MTYGEICDEIVATGLADLYWPRKDATKWRSGRQFWEASPTGELFHVFEAAAILERFRAATTKPNT